MDFYNTVLDTDLFKIGGVFPPIAHQERVFRYRDNKKLFKGNTYEVFKNVNLPDHAKNTLYVSVNLVGLICKKSSDFLFGEDVIINAGNGEGSKEQAALDRFVDKNDLNILLYESALSNAYTGDSFIKVRYGQEYAGEYAADIDEKRVIIEPINSEYVFPQTVIWDHNKIKVFHIAIPMYDYETKEWYLTVESHFSGHIEYNVYSLSPLNVSTTGEVETWTITGHFTERTEIVKTGIKSPLVVHIPNMSTSDSWEGIDDVTELYPLIVEINNRLTSIADVLNKHSNPALAVPSGLLEEDEHGNAQFRVSMNKVFEVTHRDDILPEYITWNGNLNEAFQELDRLIDLVLTTAEIPGVALGRGDSGTSGSSGLAIKWRMNSLLSKVNRKRQYYNKGIKQVLRIAQELEVAVGIAEYDVITPVITFNDGLPKDDMEQANIMSIRTGGMKTMSQKTAIMQLGNLTSDQADRELELIKDEESREFAADPSVFNTDFMELGTPEQEEIN